MRLYSYVVRWDIGFAPNPFHSWCTLATCKQDIRRNATIGDWIVGTGSAAKNLEDRLVYAMAVEEILTFDSYWEDPRFASKRPNRRGSLKQRYGDNIYHRDAQKRWIQADSRHSLDNGTPNEDHIKRDTKADAVLAGREFVYFGGSGPLIPGELRGEFGVDLCHGRPSYRVNFPPDMQDATVSWLKTLPRGLCGDPSDW